VVDVRATAVLMGRVVLCCGVIQAEEEARKKAEKEAKERAKEEEKKKKEEEKVCDHLLRCQRLITLQQCLDTGGARV